MENTKKVILLLGVLFFFMEWMSFPLGSIQFNQYDLAEWLSLFPQERLASVGLVTVFLMRFQWICWGILVTVHTNRFFTGLIAVLLFIALLPPAEFLQTPTDINYQQQLLIAILSLLLPIASKYILPTQYTYRLVVIVSLLGLTSLGFSFATANSLIHEYNLQPHWGIAWGGMAFIYGASLLPQKQRG